jgi:hypothetical protein
VRGGSGGSQRSRPKRGVWLHNLSSTPGRQGSKPA